MGYWARDGTRTSEDILAYAFAQCRSNKGAPGVDGQDGTAKSVLL
jgi:hypothetical protein